MICPSHKPTADQKRAIISKKLITFAVSGPGTGKTFTIATRMRHLTTTCRIAADRILAFTFSNRAAVEMEAAVARLAPGVQFPWLGTTHAICARILEAEGHVFDICDEYQQWELVDEIINKVAPSQEINADDVIEYIGWRKTRTTETHTPIPREYERQPIYRTAYKRYQKRLNTEQLKDFNDLLRDTVKMLERHPKMRRRYQAKFTHVLADELQDFAPLQVKLLMLLKSARNYLFLVGDDDQVIYSWLGAEPMLIKKLIKAFPRTDVMVVKLRHNFRSKQEIMDGASGVITNNKGRIEKHFKVMRGPGTRIHIRPSDSANQLAESIANKIEAFIRQKGYEPHRIAVLARKRIAWRHTRRVLEEHGIPCSADVKIRKNRNAMRLLVDAMKGIITDSKETGLSSIKNERLQATVVRNYRVWCKLAKKPPIALAQAIIKELKLEKADLRRLLDQMPKYPTVTAFLQDFKPYGHKFNDVQLSGVQFKTIHGAKGMEFDAVFILGAEQGVLPDERALTSPAALEEERRLMYVAMTRARNRLFIYYLKESRHLTNLRLSAPSQFIAEIPDDCKYYPIRRDRPQVTDGPIPMLFVTDHLPGDTAVHSTYGYGKIIKIVGVRAIVKFSSSAVRNLPLKSLQKARFRTN